jgi:hypothetical protein
MYKRAPQSRGRTCPLVRPDHTRDHYPVWGFPCLSEAQDLHYQQPIYIYIYIYGEFLGKIQ